MIKPTQQAIQTDLFSPNLVDIIDLKHPLVILSKKIDWENIWSSNGSNKSQKEYL